VRLSGGQRQRIGIARALYLDPPILVFDEATSALDVETEKDVMKSLEYLRTDRTILIVTHRLSALEHCDQTITIENGAA
jgi:ABC-type bacteriocin/lantibiotic exporter with double-glycine peptidase domain